MTPPPLPAVVVAGGLAWNLRNSRAGKPTISRWACRNKKIAVPLAVAGSCWLTAHWWLYVVEG